MPEKSLNLLLRRADWRFLLSNPNPGKSVCFSAGVLADAVEYISEDIIRPASKVNDCDLAVATNPEEDTLLAALSALRAGGSCYIEYSITPLFNPKSVKKKLEQLGFDKVDIYLPKPPPLQSTTKQWIPLESKGAVNYSLMIGSEDKTTPILIRLLQTLRRALWSYSPDLYMNYPWFLSSFLKHSVVCAVACKPEEGISTAAEGAHNLRADEDTLNLNNTFLQGVLLSHRDAPENEERARKVFKLMLTEGKHSGNKIIFFVFSGNDHKPLFVAKTTRVSDSIKSLKNEADVLSALHDPKIGIDGIPKILFTENKPGVYTVGESFIQGVFIKDILTKNNFRDLALKATDLLARLATETKHRASADWRESLVGPILSEFISLYDSVLHPDHIERTKEKFADFTLEHVYCEHRDFSPWNVLLLEEGNLGALDWESSVMSGLPATDLIYFLTYLSSYLEKAHKRAKFIESYSRLRDESTFTGAVFKECLDSYTSTLGIQNSDTHLLGLITWIIHASSEYKDMGHIQDSSLRSEALKNSLFYNLWQYELEYAGR